MQQPRPIPGRRVVEAVLSAALADWREGRLAQWPRRHPRLSRWLAAHRLSPVLETAGDRWPAEGRLGRAMGVYLTWAITQLRPDGVRTLDDIDEAAWLVRTSWRPVLALACHSGVLAVPDLPSRYRRRSDESPADNLCGLWAVGPSTFYRYLDKGKRQLAGRLAEPASAADDVGLRDHTDAAQVNEPPPPAGWAAWHAGMAEEALREGCVTSSLWHGVRAGQPDLVLVTLQRDPLGAAHRAETDVLLDRLQSMLPPHGPQRVELALARAELWRHRAADEHEHSQLQLALRLADAQADPRLLGRVFLALGRYHESRNADRALACFDEAARASARPTASGMDTGDVALHATALVRMAWLHVRRNDPSAKALMQRADQLRQSHALPDDLLGDMEQTWGEYWRRAGDLRRALEHKHRALNIAQRLGQRRAELTAYLNLSLIYGEARDFVQAAAYGQKVLQAAQQQSVEPEILIGAHGNLGVAHFFQGHYAEAIQAYQEVLRLACAAGLRSHEGTAHYNLAEAHYKRFQHGGDPADEQAGDRHAGIAMRIAAEDGSAGLVEAGRTLKREVLGDAGSIDRLLPAEHAAHFEEMAEVDRLRRQLAVPAPAADRARLHLDIARHYATIAAREREAALALLAPHGVTPDLAGAVEAVRRAFERGLTREQRLAQDWQQAAHDLLADGRRQAVLAHLLAHGSIQKSAYAEVAQVSLATASKHLGLLAERGLLLQTGKGPSTRYLAVDRAEAASSR